MSEPHAPDQGTLGSVLLHALLICRLPPNQLREVKRCLGDHPADFEGSINLKTPLAGFLSGKVCSFCRLSDMVRIFHLIYCLPLCEYASTRNMGPRP